MQQKNIEPWDRPLAPLVALGSGFIVVVAGFDKLYAWSLDNNLALELVSLLLILAGYAIGTYALMENRFFSGVVRIQNDRGQVVVSSGPYAWVRHPGYAGVLLAYIGMPFFLDSLWAVLPAIFSVIALVIRTALEDRTLQQRLEGYPEYAQHVRYRLLPGIW